ERAEMATEVGADITVRIHGNGDDNSSVNGALTMAPSTSNPYVSELAAESQALSKCIIDAYCNATGMKNRGVMITDTMTGINWCTMPVTIVELGFMSNPTDDTNMQDDAYQVKMVNGIANGIDAYFAD
ncbi:MAG: N-acetylmuramoyl-L-alanine amidase, partial [Lachnospiraceae bacterium]|nr:N-acetylmuramoyl-L-alanine amidase [Lachnospiraceae bacterium]